MHLRYELSSLSSQQVSLHNAIKAVCPIAIDSPAQDELKKK